MVSIKHLVLAVLFAAGAAFGISTLHGTTFHGASVTSTHVQVADGGNPVPPNL